MRDFNRLAGWQAGLALSAVLMSGIAAVLEGIALTFLIPVIQQGGISGNAHKVLPWMAWLNIKPSNIVTVALVFFVVLGFCASLSRFATEVMLLRLRTRIECLARTRMGHALLHMEWPAFLGLKLGDISKTQIIEGQQMAVGTQLYLQSMGAGLATVAYFAIALAISPEMTAYTLAFGVLGAFLYRISSRWARRHSDTLSSIVSSIGTSLSDIFSGLKYIRATGMVTDAETRSRKLYVNYERAYLFSQLYALGNRFVFESASLIFIAVFLAYQLVGSSGNMASGLLFIAVFYRLAPRFQQMQDGFFQTRTYHSWVLTWRNRLEKAENAQTHTYGSKHPEFRNELDLQEISYRYPGAEVNALCGVNLAIHRGETVAVVGGSGGGKTTMLDMLTGLLQPTEGRVLLDGLPLDEFDLGAWHQQIGLVMQETPLIHESVLSNIVWGAAELDTDLARECARMAHALDFIDRLPEGMNTVIGERGGRLSGGQKQRIVLARALYRRPALLILDEPTSALDSESEAAVQAALSEIKGRCTMLIVAHRLKTVQFADRIVVLDQGRIVEDGRWDELVNKPGGKLAQLVSLQGLG